MIGERLLAHLLVPEPRLAILEKLIEKLTMPIQLGSLNYKVSVHLQTGLNHISNLSINKL